MSEKIDAKEVLLCLNELGYTNINAQQLKEFIKDLKKLMKYEENQHSKPQNDTSSSDISSLTENFHSQRSVEIKDQNAGAGRNVVLEERNDVFTNLYYQDTISSCAKKVNKKESVISVQIQRPVRIGHHSDPHIHCVHHNSFATTDNASSRVSRCKSDSQLTVHSENVTNIHPEVYVESASGDAVDNAKLRRAKGTKFGATLRPKSSFIRPPVLKTLKTDPVALYHQYQEEWRRQKIPGEDNRADLRWAIREKMLGGPSVMPTAFSVEALNRKRQFSGRA